MAADVQVHAEVQGQANEGRLNGNAEEKTTSTVCGQSVDTGTDSVDGNDKNMQWVMIISHDQYYTNIDCYKEHG